MSSTNVGIIGCGSIFPSYMEGFARLPHLQVLRCADLVPERARRGHEEFGIPRFGTTEELLADPEIEVVVNLTWPHVHAQVTSAALRAGKHVYSEKTFATTLQDADDLMAQADAAGLSLGSAPDTFLGSWGATSRAAVDSGLLGDIVAATAFIKHNWVETRHPDPGFLFQPGAGPTLDRGPYYVTALVNLLGPVSTVMGMATRGPATRTITAPGRLVDEIPVEIDTHETALLQFASGAVATFILSSDVWGTELPDIEVYGTRATLSLPNPNFFDGDVQLAVNDQPWVQPSRFARNIVEWQRLSPIGQLGGQRAMGVDDLVSARGGAPQKTSPALARHVLEVLLAIGESARTLSAVPITSTTERPHWTDLPTLDICGVR